MNRVIQYNCDVLLDEARARVDYLETRLAAAREELATAEAARTRTSLGDFPADVLLIIHENLEEEYATSMLRLVCRRFARLFRHEEIHITAKNYRVVTPDCLAPEARLKVDYDALGSECIARLAIFGDRPIRIRATRRTRPDHTEIPINIRTIIVDEGIRWKDIADAFVPGTIQSLTISMGQFCCNPGAFPNLKQLQIVGNVPQAAFSRTLSYSCLEISMNTFRKLMSAAKFTDTDFIVTASPPVSELFHPRCSNCRVKFIGLEPRHIECIEFMPRGIKMAYNVKPNYLGDGWYQLSS